MVVLMMTKSLYSMEQRRIAGSRMRAGRDKGSLSIIRGLH